MGGPALWRTVDFRALPKHFDSAAAERRWSEAWEAWGVYRYDPSRPREETFVVDTPPPTVSGSLHVGHVFSYTHTDILVRFQRMRGKNIFYPMGWDDNGLPTERRVQNYFHVRCDPHVPYDPGLKVAAATARERKKPPRVISRRNFIELCHRLTREDEKVFKALWRRTGLSVDWREEYATIDRHCRTLAQLSFLDLYEKGHVYMDFAPTMWDVDFQTAVAQAEVVDRTEASAFHDLEFGVEGTEERFVIATTRPELLPACVGVAAHPEDPRYRHLFGRRALTPLFRVPVPIFASPLVDREKGTGILMVCTFGDATDVEWWRTEGLPLRQIIGRDGRLVPVTFGEPPFECLDPEAANRAYRELAGKSVRAARRRIVELLRAPEADALGVGRPPLRGEPRPITHTVRYYEKGEHPLEYLPTRQWFVRLLDKKEALLARGREVQWHPPHMRARYENWTENLQLDWCISRQRYFGVPIPVWYPLDEEGRPQYDRPLLPAPETLPVDPMSHVPPGYTAEQRDRPGGFTGEADVFDTWFTSSLTPQIGSHWHLNPERHRKLFPMDIRPQSHEIIRTWAFYTIVKAHLHENTIPWRHVVISGWILDPDRKKMSKSHGNVVTPVHLFDRYGADAVRYWAASARLGMDTAFDEKVFAVGKRLVVKIFNASKFVLAQTAAPYPIAEELDRAFLWRLREMAAAATADFEAFDYARALDRIEGFFWQSFTDTYIEFVKARSRGDVGDEGARGSAVAALRRGLQVLLRLFAPFLPFITEEVWSWVFAEETGWRSIHRAPWPSAADFADVQPPADPGAFDLAVSFWSAVNKRKTEARVSVGRPVLRLRVRAHPDALRRLGPFQADLQAATRTRQLQWEETPDLGPEAFEVLEAVFAGTS